MRKLLKLKNTVATIRSSLFAKMYSQNDDSDKQYHSNYRETNKLIPLDPEHHSLDQSLTFMKLSSNTSKFFLVFDKP